MNINRLLHLLCLIAATATQVTTTATAQNATPRSQMERLGRGTVAIHHDGGNFVGWRLLGDEGENVTFDIIRDGQTIARDVYATNYNEAGGEAGAVYEIVKKTGGEAGEPSEPATAWGKEYKTMRLDRPQGGSFHYAENDSTDCYAYYAQEGSVADVDGDGKYELLVKWTPSNAKDNSASGFTGNVYYDCYHIEPGTADEPAPQRLWRIDLGKNIRAGSHYSQPMFFDFDGDGRAELICKTGPGTTDGTGRYVTEAADDEGIRATDNQADYRNDSGHILDGPEFLTVFDGQSGRAVHTIWYNPNRGFTCGRTSGYGAWGDDYGNRGERFLACVAYLDGADKNPCAVMCRGYYTQAYLWAVDFDGMKLRQKWLHASRSKQRVEVSDANGNKSIYNYSSNTSGTGDNYTAYGQGCHSIAVGDVDGDGCDEIMYGAAAIDNDGRLLYSTGLGHGDAHHLGVFMPDRQGLQFMMPHEDTPYGWHVRDAATGELLIRHSSAGDNGRGMAAVISQQHRGGLFWSAANYDVYDINDQVVASGEEARPAYCFRIFWDGDAYDELLDGVNITKWNNGRSTRIYQAPNHSMKNGTKAYPLLAADLFGDWREEVVWCCATDSATINIASTTTETALRVPTLMHDHVYRMSVAWQNVAYNQPPHLGYYLPDSVAAGIIAVDGLKEQTVELGNAMKAVTCRLKNCTGAMPFQTFLNGKRISSFSVPEGFSYEQDSKTRLFTLNGTPQKAGLYEFAIRTTGSFDGTNITDTIRINVTQADAIDAAWQDEGHGDRGQTYTIGGQPATDLRPGNVYIIRKNGKYLKTTTK
jgi:rhamnogalacturonan endolyase